MPPNCLRPSSEKAPLPSRKQRREEAGVQPVVRLVLGLGDHPLDFPAIGVDLLGGVERIRILRVDVVVAQIVGIDLVQVCALGEGPVPPGRVPSSTSRAYGEMPTEFVLPRSKGWLELLGSDNRV